MALQHLRSSTANKRPDPTAMAAGQLAINSEATSPGLFFKDSAGNLVKIGPVHVGTTAPNATPASGGTAGNSTGEIWLDTTGGAYDVKVWDGSAWRSQAGEFVNIAGDTMTGDLTMGNQSDLRFGEATANGSNWVAFQGAANIAANVTWTLPATDATVSGHALKSDAAGTLSWGTAGGAAGGGTDDVFYENAQTVTTSYTLTTNKNAMSAGPITINSGATVTVPSGQSWVIV